ncbi:monocarboxylate permease-like protein, mch4 [Xylariomycetidae sp. FL2044]|nr:monocarboxylate permease-like protein, mch4 [Xylariomycetidae sp. FL2044]
MASHGSSKNEPNESALEIIGASSDGSGEKGSDRAATTKSEDTVPDCGLQAWLQVVGSYALYFNTWGLINAFGVFQTFYENDLLRHMSPSDISWIGSAQSFFLLVVGVISGPLYDAGYLRHLLVAGTVLVPLGMMLTSLCSEYWQVMLAQALCVGVGTGCLYVPSVAIIPQYFHKRRALAMGVVTSGSSFGGVIYSLLFQGLQPRIGFAWTTRVMGFISLVTIAIALLVLRRRTEASRIRSLVDLSAFRERPYVIYCVAVCLSFTAFFAPVFYLQSYALTHGLEGQTVALYLVAILNAASVLGRLSPSFVANKIGPIHTLFICVTLTGVSTFSWINTNTGAGNIGFSVAFGFFSGGIVALPAVVLTSFTKDLSRLGTRLGMSSVINAVGSLVGAPIAGVILSATGDYLGVQLFAGFVIMATSVCLVALRFAVTGRSYWVKA